MYAVWLWWFPCLAAMFRPCALPCFVYKLKQATMPGVLAFSGSSMWWILKWKSRSWPFRTIYKVNFCNFEYFNTIFLKKNDEKSGWFVVSRRWLASTDRWINHIEILMGFPSTSIRKVHEQVVGASIWPEKNMKMVSVINWLHRRIYSIIPKSNHTHISIKHI